MDKLEFIAKIRYLGWICYQMGANLPLHDVDDTYKISSERLIGLIAGTKWALEHPDATPEDNHKSWMESKISQGYTYGEQLSVENKTHPSLVDYAELPDVEKRKDDMDLLMVKLGEQLFNELSCQDNKV